MSKAIITGLALILATSFPVLSEERRELGAHEHGHGKLDIAVEGNKISMELEVPGADIAGFEHEASNDKENAVIEKAKATLADAQELFVFPKAANCALKDAKVEIVEEEHDEGKKEANHAHKDKGEPAETHHNEIRAAYALECKVIAEAKSLSLNYFKTFSNAEELDVTVITPKGQTKFEVTGKKPVLDLSGLM